jgi:Zn-dependent peptidase ImmA (M78 family)
MPWSDIRKRADSFRQSLRLESEPFFPIVQVLEEVLDPHVISFEIGSVDEMPGILGETCPHGEFIRLREDVYEDALGGQGRARFTAAHELGHFDLHAGSSLKRVQDGDELPAFRCVEKQANQYAAELLMPVQFFSPNDTVDDVIDRHGVSRMAARFRLDYLWRKRLI